MNTILFTYAIIVAAISLSIISYSPVMAVIMGYLSGNLISKTYKSVFASIKNLFTNAKANTNYH